MKLFETRSLGNLDCGHVYPVPWERRDLDDRAVLPSGSRGPSVPDDSFFTGMLLSLTVFPGKEIATIFASLLLFRKAAKHLHSDSDIFNHFFRVNGYYHIDGKSLFIGGHR